MNDWKLNPGERLDDLVRNGLKLIQRPDQFCFSMDSVLLAHFTFIRPIDRYADLGTGTGVIAILMAAMGARDITGFEINPIQADLARRNVAGNHLEKWIRIVETDYRDPRKLFPMGYFSSIVCNPPYRALGTGEMNSSEGIALGSYEINATLKDVFHTTHYLLKYGGRLTMVHRADRLADIIAIGREFNMEPKKMRFVYARQEKTASRVLIEFKYGGHPELTVEPPLVLHNKNGSYTDEVRRIYGKGSNE